MSETAQTLKSITVGRDGDERSLVLEVEGGSVTVPFESREQRLGFAAALMTPVERNVVSKALEGLARG